MIATSHVSTESEAAVYGPFSETPVYPLLKISGIDQSVSSKEYRSADIIFVVVVIIKIIYGDFQAQVAFISDKNNTFVSYMEEKNCKITDIIIR